MSAASRSALFTLLAAFATTARAEEPAGGGVPQPYLVHVTAGINVLTLMPPTATAGFDSFNPTTRLAIQQQVGAGYFLTPNLRIQLALQLGQTLTGRPEGVPPLTMVALIPWLVYVHGRFFTGAGPLVSIISGGQLRPDVGIFTGHGYSFPLGDGFSVVAAAQIALFFQPRLAFAFAPACAFVKRF